VLFTLDFAPPRASPSPLLLSSKAGEVLGLTPSNWRHGTAEVPSANSSSCPAFVSAAPMGSRSGVGTIVQRNEDFAEYTALNFSVRAKASPGIRFH